MIKVAIVILACIGTYILSRSFMPGAFLTYSNTISWVVTAIIGVAGMGLSGK